MFDYAAQAMEEVRKADADDLVRKHLRLALALAYRIHHPSIDFDERLGVANLALCEAAEKWPNSEARQTGIPFHKYAGLQIRHALIEAIEEARRGGATIPRRGRYHIRRLANSADALAQKLGRMPSDQEVAEALGWPVERVRWLRDLALTRDAVSLNAPGLDDDDTPLSDQLADDTVDVEAEVLDELAQAPEAEQVRAAVNELPPRLRATVSLRAGLEIPACATMTVDEVLQVGKWLHEYTKQAMRRLRRDAQDIRPGAKLMVRANGENPRHFGLSRSTAESPARIHWAQDFWRCLTSSGELPPALANVGK